MTLLLHSYWRATAPYRVRIGLAIKGLAFDYAPINLLKDEQGAAPYRDVYNRQALLPSLTVDGQTFTQSLAILEWLEETYPQPSILPGSAADRAIIRGMAEIVACDIHPINNLRILKALEDLGHPRGGEEQQAWGARWIGDGFAALEPMVARHGRGFAFGDTPTLADCALIPQLWSASRFAVDLAAFPALKAVADHAAAHPAFQAAHPDRQPDKPVS
jgi:maleylacetoacetate isomerase/maleylpyruvate isomerase